MSNNLYRLDSSASTLLLLSIDNAIPAVIYYGKRLTSELDAQMALQLTADAIPNAKLDSRTQLPLLPENSRGHFGEAGLQGTVPVRNLRTALRLLMLSKLTTRLPLSPTMPQQA